MMGKGAEELILTLHGLGEPHPLVGTEETRYWWDVASFVRVLDQILQRPGDADPRILITFDDGNASDALFALPELARRRLKATFFICAGRIGKMYYLDEFMIKDLLDSGMTIGSHGMSHKNWRSLDSAGLDTEISEARKILEDVTQRRVNKVSIPFGAYDRRVLNRLAREGFDCIYTSDGGTARVNAKMKPRETLKADKLGGDLLRELLTPRPMHIRMTRALVYFYKGLR